MRFTPVMPGWQAKEIMVHIGRFCQCRDELEANEFVAILGRNRSAGRPLSVKSSRRCLRSLCSDTRIRPRVWPTDDGWSLTGRYERNRGADKPRLAKFKLYSNGFLQLDIAKVEAAQRNYCKKNRSAASVMSNWWPRENFDGAFRR